MPGADQALEILRRIHFFSHLSDASLQALADSVFLAHYRKNQILFIEGEPARTLFFICTGRVKVYRTSPDGREQILHLLSDGDPISVVPFLDGGPYPATAEVLEDSRIAGLHFDDFQRIASAHPDILFQMLRTLAARLRAAQEDITALSLKNVTARLSSRLLDLSHRYGVAREEGMEVDLNLSRQELGSLIGASRETTTRLLHQFQREGVIKIDGSKITILDPDALHMWADQ